MSAGEFDFIKRIVSCMSDIQLRLVEDRQRRVREQLLDCREAAESGDGHAQV